MRFFVTDELVSQTYTYLFWVFIGAVLTWFGPFFGVQSAIAQEENASGGGNQAASVNTYHQMPTMVVQTPTDPILGLSAYDADALFETGQSAFEQSDYIRSARAFSELARLFPESPLVPDAHYNAGLSYEKQAAWGDAARQYSSIIEASVDTKMLRDVYFRLAQVLSHTKDWKGVISAFSALSAMHHMLDTMDELEVRVGTGVGQFMLGLEMEAEHAFLEAVQIYESAKNKEELPAKYFIAQARFYLGEISARAFESFELIEANYSKTSTIAEDAWTTYVADRLETKCEYLLTAQNNFLRTIRIGHQGWATAAGYRMGSLYEKLFDEVISLPEPPGLETNVIDLYREELRKKVKVLIEKASDIYKLNTNMASRVGEQNEWVEKTQAALERMRTLYVDP